MFFVVVISSIQCTFLLLISSGFWSSRCRYNFLRCFFFWMNNVISLTTAIHEKYTFSTKKTKVTRHQNCSTELDKIQDTKKKRRKTRKQNEATSTTDDKDIQLIKYLIVREHSSRKIFVIFLRDSNGYTISTWTLKGEEEGGWRGGHDKDICYWDSSD